MGQGRASAWPGGGAGYSGFEALDLWRGHLVSSPMPAPLGAWTLQGPGSEGQQPCLVFAQEADPRCSALSP